MFKCLNIHLSFLALNTFIFLYCFDIWLLNYLYGFNFFTFSLIFEFIDISYSSIGYLSLNYVSLYWWIRVLSPLMVGLDSKNT